MDRYLTFYKSYKMPINEVEHLFFRHYKSLINHSYKTKLQDIKGTYHSRGNLPKNIKSWNINIKNYLEK